MKILTINGSPKGKNSSTNVMIESFCRGVEKAGVETETIVLKDKNINNCTGCFSCWEKTPGKCIFNDDMKEILLKCLEIDILVFASPVYCDNITGILKTFVDRMITMGTPYFEKDENGEYRHGDEEIRKRRTPKFVMLSNAGFPENSHFQVISNWINRYARNARGEVIAEIYRGQGALLSAKLAELSPIIEEYKKQLESAGEELIVNGIISEKLQLQLEKDLIPHDIYIKNATRRWDNNRLK